MSHYDLAMLALAWLFMVWFGALYTNLRRPHIFKWAGQLSRYSNWLQAGRPGDRIPVGTRLSTPVQTGPEAHPASCTMGTGSFPGVKSRQGVMLTPYPLLVPWSRKSRAILLLFLWVVWLVQNLSDCTRVHFTFFLHIFRHQISEKKLILLLSVYGILYSFTFPV